jgi:hypothetical protein
MKRVVRNCLAIISFIAPFLTGCSNILNHLLEPTPAEVLNKASAELGKGGYVFDGKARQKLSAGSVQGIDQDIRFTLEMTSKPPARHMKGSLKMLGQDMKMEMYELEEETYRYIEPIGWKKWSGPGLDAGIGQNPHGTIKKLIEVIDSLGGEPTGVSMRKEGTRYMVEVDYTKFGKNRDVVQQIIDTVKGNMDSGMLEKRGVHLKLDDMKVLKFKESLWIDSGTFRPVKVMTEADIIIPTDRSEMKVEQRMELQLRGEFSGKIEVPEQVKKSVRQ